MYDVDHNGELKRDTVPRTSLHERHPDAFRWRLRPCGHWARPEAPEGPCRDCERYADDRDCAMQHQLEAGGQL